MRKLAKQKLNEHLEFLYSKNRVLSLSKRILAMLNKHLESLSYSQFDGQAKKFDEKESILITYGDIIQDTSRPALQNLRMFLDSYLADQVNAVHILPFFPYSSDDGFSVIDYRKIDPNLGTWEDFRELAKTKKIMVDMVINHISRESKWFKGFLNGDPEYRDYFIQPDDSWDLSQVVRPRTSPLLTEVETIKGPAKVWTTFSADQVDLNFSNPEVLLNIIDVLLFYIRQGVKIIRLDAIAYLWKESGTTCIHLPQTHCVVKLLRLVLECASPQIVLITETNVPHLENISYFGEFDPSTGRTDEAHMVYQFPLAPLVLHTLISGSTNRLSTWVESLIPTGTFFNFIASHDGIGVLPAKGLITEEELQGVVDQVRRYGGMLSYRVNPDGSQTLYELNTTLYDALNNPNDPDPIIDMERFLVSQVILISLAGVPGIYYHSLFGSRNAIENVEKTGRARSINREKFLLSKLTKRLETPGNIHTQIFNRYRYLLSVRTNEPSFHPDGAQKVLWVDDRVFCLKRTAPDKSSSITALVNVSPDVIELALNADQLLLNPDKAVIDLITKTHFHLDKQKLIIKLKPYQSFWLKSE